ncbi:MAG TPA: AAA family ATPase [Thermodesulfovibrionales bacterium]|nr:AAA family ATPase [Thermodesulfovibrionales bacterium]
MYKEYFDLKELPFSIAPDPRYLYMSDKHREALAHLVYGIQSDGGFVLLTGEVGTGKTTICRCLLEQVPENSDIAFILNPKLSVAELLATLCDELGIQYPESATSVKDYVDRINAYLLEAHAKGRKTVLIIEEAQNLSADVLEQLRLLTNLETNECKLLQIILLGQPELKEMLSRPELRQLAQRITARYHLESLSKKEVGAYVSHRLAIAGSRSQLFPPASIERLFRLSGGVPRLINLLCDRALLGAYVQEQNQVDIPTLSKAAQEVLGKTNIQVSSFKKMRWRAAGLLLVGSAALAASLYTHKTQPAETKASESVGPMMAAKKSQEPDTLQWPNHLSVHLSRQMAYQALLGKWNLHFDEKTSGDPCRQVQTQGLRCLTAQGNLNSLLNLNRPAVLTLFDDSGRQFYATLSALQGQTATFVVGTETRTVEVREVEKKWLGDYTLFWRTPPDFRAPLRPGQKGTMVLWLNMQLALIQGKNDRPRKNLLYEGELVAQLKKFQLSEGLMPDGVVGPQTIIHLNTLTASGEPLLYDKMKGQ